MGGLVLVFGWSWGGLGVVLGWWRVDEGSMKGSMKGRWRIDEGINEGSMKGRQGLYQHVLKNLEHVEVSSKKSIKHTINQIKQTKKENKKPKEETLY